jgi:hypothetical protein
MFEQEYRSQEQISREAAERSAIIANGERLCACGAPSRQPGHESGRERGDRFSDVGPQGLQIGHDDVSAKIKMLIGPRK